MDIKLNVEQRQVILTSPEGKMLVRIPRPVELEFWSGLQRSDPAVYTAGYDSVVEQENGIVCCADICDEQFGTMTLSDTYTVQNCHVVVKRCLRIQKAGTLKGVRLLYSAEPFPEDAPLFEDLRYFSPPAIFDKNDLDEDGVEDYFHTKNLLYRDDRMNYPMFMAYSEKRNTALRFGRYVLPAYDSYPARDNLESTFLQKTDIGSLGVLGVGERQLQAELRAVYPFYESTCVGLSITKPVPFGAFWPVSEGETLMVSYEFTARSESSFNKACWENIRCTLLEHDIKPVVLVADDETIVRYRLEALERYYVEKTKEEDENCPAGYVLNCHPQKGEQLENIIQYGFTGQNVLNAYNLLRYGLVHGIEDYIDHAYKTANFFADHIHIPSVGMFYNLYNVDQKCVNFWWTGLLLPLAYAQDKELSSLMGPLYEYRKDIIETLRSLEGAYIRCMSEDADALLKLYWFEKDRGIEHGNWLFAVRNYCDFLVRVQEEDGSWYRAYDMSGNAIKEPQIWFGATIYEQRSSTGSAIPVLVRMYELTGEQVYLDTAVRAGLFVKEYHIDRVRYNGGVHDSIYAKGQLIDNESMLYPMFAMLALYKATNNQVFLDGAIDSGHFCASWVCLWDVPLPKDSTLAKYGFRTTGIGACDTPGAGYTHPFQLMCVCEIAEIAALANDRELLKVAQLYWHGCNQSVALPSNDWGYKYYGLQEEGYLVSWWAVDDPMFANDTGFGHRWKGEGNKTCFPWIPAVAVKGYWALLDRFGTTDFEAIEKQMFPKE